MANIKLPFSFNGANLFTIAPDYYEFSKAGRHFIRISRDQADNGILLSKYDGNAYRPIMHSKTPFSNIDSNPELMKKIIKAALQ